RPAAPCLGEGPAYRRVAEQQRPGALPPVPRHLPVDRYPRPSVDAGVVSRHLARNTEPHPQEPIEEIAAAGSRNWVRPNSKMFHFRLSRRATARRPVPSKAIVVGSGTGVPWSSKARLNVGGVAPPMMS